MRKRKLLALLLAAALIIAALSACAAKTPDDTVLVIGVEANFSAKWNPFLGESAYDMQVINQVFAPVCQINDKNELEPYAGDIKSQVNDDGTVLYTVTLKRNMKFSDGTPVTIDDYIYGLYVRADSSFTGPSNLLESNIEGVKEYYYDNPNYSADIAAIEAECEKYATSVVTFEDFLVYGRETDLDGEWSDIETAIDDIEYYEYGDELAAIDASDEDAVFELLARALYDIYLEYFDVQGYFLSKMKSEYAQGNLAGGVNVPEITGIKKVNNLSCTILVTKIDIYMDRGLTAPNGSGNLIPKHYYGEITKGNVAAIEANMVPIGSGPYKFVSYADNIVTCEANVDFFLGVPRTKTVRWQFIPSADILENLIAGNIDIANPTGSIDNLNELKANSHVRYDLVDNAGYGYMAMNGNNVSLNVRRGIFSLFNRAPSVEAYYGDIASVIERPMTTTLAEYPQDAEIYYEYSRDKALEHFINAGYSQQGGKLVDANGNQLVVNGFIGGGGIGDHPAYAMLVQAAEDLAALGGELQIQDVNFNVLLASMEDGTADMWIMAWGSVFDCDKSTQFHSTGGQNRYNFSDPKMDNLLETIVQTIDLNERRALVSEMLDLAMDNALELPLYQRKNIIAYNGNNVDLSSIPQATTAASYENDLWKVVVIG